MIGSQASSEASGRDAPVETTAQREREGRRGEGKDLAEQTEDTALYRLGSLQDEKGRDGKQQLEEPRLTP